MSKERPQISFGPEHPTLGIIHNPSSREQAIQTLESILEERRNRTQSSAQPSEQEVRSNFQPFPKLHGGLLSPAIQDQIRQPDNRL